ncbi:hypothetical protein PpBr36_04738 [Pyricularia pennisetigena]|uniref:hypothetical protein n=1 Tax=Pyricularia pennisetigena TaxID=1578925 RepID=UPI0011542F86|nr:hypothetical protein PpBr36_04738 [Pyricularia pennisetigena]TLS27476.1 hypothetical protein PpBr36_04738 [Pyricularia pennisetigena]
MEAAEGKENLFRTERLLFRGVEGSDVAFIHEMESDPVNHVLSYPTLLVPPSTQSSAGMVAMLEKSLLSLIVCLRPGSDGGAESSDPQEPNGIRHAEDRKATAYIQQLREDPIPVGYLCINLGDHALPFDLRHNGNARLGIMIATRFQNKGYGTEATKWAIDWTFRFARMHSVRVESIGYNHRAHAVYRKLGLKVDGRLREAHYHDRKWHDVVCMSILETEWENMQSLEHKSN